MRPQLAHFKAKLVGYLGVQDPYAGDCLGVLLEHYKSVCVESEALCETDERYQQNNMELLTRRGTNGVGPGIFDAKDALLKQI